MEEIIIVGGGVAGLSCLNALVDKGFSPLLIEGAKLGTPKMCGEFLAPKAVQILERWNIDGIEPIKQAYFKQNNTTLPIQFTQWAGAISRSKVEILLANRARLNQARIQEQTYITEVKPATLTTPYIFTLASGVEIRAKTAIFAIGKYNQTQHVSLPYYGIKLHVPYVETANTLHMYSRHNAYFGIVPIGDEMSNVACLARQKIVAQAGSCREFFRQLLNSDVLFKPLAEHIQFDDSHWFESKAPDFQVKRIPDWPHAYWIGDALASLHPAIGSGFAHSITSATLAAECYAQNHLSIYHTAARKQVLPKAWIGKLMHHIMLNPLLARTAFSLLNTSPKLLNAFLYQLNYIDN